MKFISSHVRDTSEIFEFIMRITFFFRMSAIIAAMVDDFEEYFIQHMKCITSHVF